MRLHGTQLFYLSGDSTTGDKLTYSLLPSPRPTTALGCWESQLPSFSHVVGYSWLGHIFLLNENTDECAVLYPFRQAYKGYGIFNSLAEFESAVLKDQGFVAHVLKPDHQAATHV